MLKVYYEKQMPKVMRHKNNKVWYDHLQIDFNVLNVLLNTDLNAVLKIIQILFSLVLDQPAVMKKKIKKSAFNSSFPNKKLGKTITIRQSAHPSSYRFSDDFRVSRT